MTAESFMSVMLTYLVFILSQFYRPWKLGLGCLGSYHNHFPSGRLQASSFTLGVCLPEKWKSLRQHQFLKIVVRI